MNDIVEKLKTNILDLFENKNAQYYFAPGRVNIIGEYTDFNGGAVLPCSISLGTYLAVNRNSRNTIRLYSLNDSFSVELNVNDIHCMDKTHQWVDYAISVMREFNHEGVSLSGLDFCYYGNLPLGSGLSSSASLELVTSVALNDIYDCKFSMQALVKISQKAENNFVGVQCGIMDQFAIGFAEPDKAICLSCSDLAYEMVPIDFSKYSLVIVNSNKSRELADSKYNERRIESEKALAIAKSNYSISDLCDLKLVQLEQIKGQFSETVVYRRAMHVVTEHERVNAAVIALKNSDAQSLGALMNLSHQSLKDDYEVTGSELDALVAIAQSCEYVVGARMTGAGFGGCTVNLVESEKLDQFYNRVAEQYLRLSGLKATFIEVETVKGARKLLF